MGSYRESFLPSSLRTLLLFQLLVSFSSLFVGENPGGESPIWRHPEVRVQGVERRERNKKVEEQCAERKREEALPIRAHISIFVWPAVHWHGENYPEIGEYIVSQEF